MDKPLIYSTEQVRSYDLNSGFLPDIDHGLSDSIKGCLNFATALVSNFNVNATGSMNLQIADNSRVIAPLHWSYNPETTAVITRENLSSTITLNSSGIPSGKVQWALVAVGFTVTRSVRAGDPTGGILYYFNPDNPETPWIGANNNKLPQDTKLSLVTSTKVVYGIPNSLGLATPPYPAPGWTAAYLILLYAGQTIIESSEILKAGPGVGPGVPSNYPSFPNLTGLVKQHHTGITGQAPKVILTDGLEVQGILPLSCLSPVITGNILVDQRKIFACPSGNSPGYPVFRLVDSSDLPGTGFVSPLLVYAGPTSGSQAVPTFRSLMTSDFGPISPENVQIFSTSGQWICPAGIHMVLVSMVAGGAGGTSGSPGSYSWDYDSDLRRWELNIMPGDDGSGGGGGGGMHQQPITVVPGEVYQIYVGAGGTQGNSGTYSSFGDTVSFPGTTSSGGLSSFLHPNGRSPSGKVGGISLLPNYGAGGAGGTGGTYIENGPYPNPPLVVSPTSGTSGQNGIVILMW